MAGLVMIDLNGGDFCFHLVDDAMWEQINHIGNSKEWTGYKELAIYQEIVEYLCIKPSAPETELSEHCLPYLPQEIKGQVIKTVYCQRYVTEDFNFAGIIKGILTFTGC